MKLDWSKIHGVTEVETYSCNVWDGPRIRGIPRKWFCWPYVMVPRHQCPHGKLCHDGDGWSGLVCVLRWERDYGGDNNTLVHAAEIDLGRDRRGTMIRRFLERRAYVQSVVSPARKMAEHWAEHWQ